MILSRSSEIISFRFPRDPAGSKCSKI